jgi:parvulin-like peptidyl-prolyl isomerase
MIPAEYEEVFMNRVIRSFSSLVIWVSTLFIMNGAACAADTAHKTANQVATSVPSVSPGAEEIVLVRFGKNGQDATLTQAEFERRMRGTRPELSYQVLMTMTREKLFMLYAQDHPDLVPARALEEAIDQTMKRDKCKTREEYERKLHETGFTWQDMQDRVFFNTLVSTFTQIGQKNANSEEIRRKRFEAAREEFDGTSVNLRQIQISVYPYDTPAERVAKRAQLAKIREDVISGKVKWENAAQQGGGPARFNGGVIGNIPRHVQVAEPIGEAAFALKVGDISEIVESEMGFHILQVISRQPGNRPFEHPDTQKDLRLWLEFEPLQKAIAEVRAKYPVIGVQQPLPLPPPPPSATATAPSTKPAQHSKMRMPPNPTSKPAKPGAVKTKPAK